MITLQVLIFSFVIYFWIDRYKNSKKGMYDISPFNKYPTFKSALGVILTLVTIILSFVYIIIYLP